MIARAGGALLGWWLAAAAWAFAVVTYPLALLYAYGIREAAAAFDASLEELAERPLPGRDRQGRAS